MATLAELLVEAEAAYHDLRIGKAVAEFRDQNGETIRYTRADIAGLAAYIRDLKQQIAAEASGCTTDEGPFRVIFL